MNILFLGAPGCGKGTQSKILIERYGIPQISTGDLLREEMGSKSDLGAKIKDIMAKGEFVDDELVLSLVSKKIESEECKKGFILDGFPRNLTQAKSLDVLLSRISKSIDYVMLIDVPDEVLIERCTGRLLCDTCDYIGNKDRGENVGDPCPVAEGTLYQRDDDKEDTVRNRLKVFKEQTSPIIDFYQDKGILQRLVGGNDPKLLSNKIIEILDK
ncbi:MAG: adenylate kinase [Gammaproteobacteria bacterium]|nr:adenylate kinase [Gammaproteobacteria bacterium]